MINNKFEVYKIKREIKKSGKDFTFSRFIKNEFGEPTDEPIPVHTIRALYYEHAPHYLDTYIIMSGSESARYRTEKTPQIIFPYEDMFFEYQDEITGEVKKDNIMIGDITIINGHLSRVSGVFNIQEWDKLVTVSFEEVDYGSKSLFPGGQKPD